jgi:geranylgeranyl diphosphate synthase type II
MMAGGKRIRPILCLAAIEALGGNPGKKNALTVACALEMIHTYSLIHDDLPAMDNDNLRRGRQTCHIAFDEATAILVGDALLTLAFQILSEIKPTDEHPSEFIIDIIRILTLAAGYRGMIAGQMTDISSEGALLSLEVLEEMYRLKTGALFEASVHTGAILAKGTLSQLKQLITYARNIGLAFQITDDILNVEGNPAVTGKSAGTDEMRQKSTYPSIIGIERSKQLTKKLINNALQALDDFDNRSDPLREIAKFIIDRNR